MSIKNDLYGSYEHISGACMGLNPNCSHFADLPWADQKL